MKTVLLFVGTWAAPLLASVVAIGVGAAVAGRGASAGEAAVLVLIPLQLLFFACGTVVFWKVSGHTAQRWVLVVVHGLAQAATALVLGFGTLVAFNR